MPHKLVIFGVGTIGILSAAMARFFGAKQIVVVDTIDHKLEFAKELNGSSCYRPDQSSSPEQNAARLIKQNALGVGADKVIEVTGAESCINTAIYVLRKGGHMIQTGLGRPMTNFPIVELSEKEIHLHGACRYGPGDFAVALEMLEKRIVPFEKLISKVFAFEDTIKAWEATKRGDGIKNIIKSVD